MKHLISPSDKAVTPPLKDVTGILYHEIDKANAFNDIFVSQTRLATDKLPDPEPPHYNTDGVLSSII